MEIRENQVESQGREKRHGNQWGKKLLEVSSELTWTAYALTQTPPTALTLTEY